jgi:type IV secretory pathway TrbL component
MKLSVLLMVALAGALYGQAAVEYGLGASRAATTTAPAAGVGKSVAGAFGSLDKTLKTADKSSSEASSTTTVPSKQWATAKTADGKAPVYEDIKKVEVGLEYDELIKRFGPPALEVEVEGGGKKLTYSSKPGSTQLEVKDGKVAVVNLPKAQQSVFILPK